MKTLNYCILLVISLLFVSWAQPLSAQITRDINLSRFDDRPLHFGYYLGLNTMDYRFSHYPDVLENPVFSGENALDQAKAETYYQGVHSYRVECYPMKPGFTVGGVANLRMSSSVDFRFTPGMSLGVRQIVFSNNVMDIINSPQGKSLYPDLTTDRYLSTPSAYIDIPAGFRYKGLRYQNVRPYIYGGLAFRRDLENKRISESALHLKRNGYYAEIGFGLDSYLPFFRLSTEFKFSYGLNNIIKHDSGTKADPYYGYVVKELNSNIFSLIFFFE